MRWPRRGILIRLFIYVPLIAILAWRARGGCGEEATMEREVDVDLDQKLDPHRRVITLPDGTQQSIVELTPAQAEEILGHPIPELDEPKPAESKPAAPAPTESKAEGSVPAGAVPAGAKAEGSALAEPSAGR
ncbi:MAG: hypothetical protein KDK70_01505 [Myxococcales bacterium]|nr:hypothetical protein [Myxococcales bacterium]